MTTRRASCIYEGFVRHRRFAPVAYAFRYRMFMMYLDLNELPTLFRGRWLWSARRRALARFRRADYLGDPSVPLDRAVRDAVQEKAGFRPVGPIRMLTHLRYFGYCFNPVTFYYCFDGAGERVEAVIAEITNTPWRERHSYVLDWRGARTPTRRFEFGKSFHVSPFLPMELEYDWKMRSPAERLAVHMENHGPGVAGKVFDATLALSRREINGFSLARVLVAYPLMTLRVISAIHWQALRLWLKRVPLHVHPAKRGRLAGGTNP